MARLIRRTLLGQPLPSSAASTERLTKPRAIGAFGLDALSSVAYGPDEILYVLLLAGTAGTAFDLPIAVAIAALLGIVAFSCRQTIHAYPHGGGSYTVARENLGIAPGLVAAAALMVDYLTTVAVSVTAGVQAVVAFLPQLDRYRVITGVAAILLLEVVTPLIQVIDDYQSAHPGRRATVILPDIVTHHIWEEPLHNQTGLAITLAFVRKPNVVVASVPVKLRG